MPENTTIKPSIHRQSMSYSALKYLASISQGRKQKMSVKAHNKHSNEEFFTKHRQLGSKEYHKDLYNLSF